MKRVVQVSLVIIQLEFVVIALNKERNKKGLWHLKCIIVNYKCYKEWVENCLQVWTHNLMKESNWAVIKYIHGNLHIISRQINVITNKSNSEILKSHQSHYSYIALYVVVSLSLFTFIEKYCMTLRNRHNFELWLHFWKCWHMQKIQIIIAEVLLCNILNVWFQKHFIHVSYV